jgi:hypothetical protein
LSPLLFKISMVPSAISGSNKGYEYPRFVFDRRLDLRGT